MLDELQRLCEECGLLRSVHYTFAENDSRFVTEVRLQFDSHEALFAAVPDDDTLSIQVRTVDHRGRSLAGSCEQEIWSRCVGRRIQWAWMLKNQRGYVDGSRLEFNANDGSETEIMEFVVVASAIRIYSLRRRLPSHERPSSAT